MQMQIIRIERIQRSGTSKAGNPYHIDQTQITIAVPLSTPDGFGVKEMTYQYGDSSNFTRLEALRDRLPAIVDMELGVELNQYGSTVTVVKDLKLSSQTKAAS